MAEVIGYCKDCNSEIYDIDEEFMITGESTDAFECPTCRQMQTKENILKTKMVSYKNDDMLFICYDIKENKYYIFTDGEHIGESEDWCETLKIFRSSQNNMINKK